MHACDINVSEKRKKVYTLEIIIPLYNYDRHV